MSLDNDELVGNKSDHIRGHLHNKVFTKGTTPKQETHTRRPVSWLAIVALLMAFLLWLLAWCSSTTSGNAFVGGVRNSTIQLASSAPPNAVAEARDSPDVSIPASTTAPLPPPSPPSSLGANEASTTPLPSDAASTAPVPTAIREVADAGSGAGSPEQPPSPTPLSGWDLVHAIEDDFFTALRSSLTSESQSLQEPGLRGVGRTANLTSASCTASPCQGCMIFNVSTMTLPEFVSNMFNQPTMDPYHPLALCELGAAASKMCRFGCDRDNLAFSPHGDHLVPSSETQLPETFIGCIARVGLPALEDALPQRCTAQPIFERIRKVIANTTKANTPASIASMTSRSAIFESESYTVGATPPTTLQDQWPEFSFGPPKHCSRRRNETVYPISFAIPREMVADRVSRDKFFDFLPYVPAGFAKATVYPFRVNDENLARELHHRSHFAFTHRRGGWDCLRHYEILASGCVPWFVDLVESPVHTMTSLPKRLLSYVLPMRGVGSTVGYIPKKTSTQRKQNINTDYIIRQKTGKKGKRTDMVFKKPGRIDWRYFNITAYNEVAELLLEHTKKYLTTRSLAAYVIDTMQKAKQTSNPDAPVFPPPHKMKVLMIGPGKFDYAHASLEHGFGDLGIETTVLGAAGPGAFATPRCGSANDSARFSVRSDAEMQALIQAWKDGSAAERREGSSVPKWCVWSEEDFAGIRKFSSKVAPLGSIQGFGWDLGFRGNPKFIKHLQIGDSKIVPDVAEQFGKDIASKKFDIVVYTFNPGAYVPPVDDRPHIAEVEKYYSKDEIAFVDGYDIRDLTLVGKDEQRSLDHAKRGVYFRREIPDKSLCSQPL